MAAFGRDVLPHVLRQARYDLLDLGQGAASALLSFGAPAEILRRTVLKGTLASHAITSGDGGKLGPTAFWVFAYDVAS